MWRFLIDLNTYFIHQNNNFRVAASVYFWLTVVLSFDIRNNFTLIYSIIMEEYHNFGEKKVFGPQNQNLI